MSHASSHLKPLPTASTSQLQHSTSTLPYPKIQEVKSHQTPMLKKQWGGQSNQGESEKQRLQELEKMLSDAQSRTAIVEQEAYDKAYAAGEKAGLALGEKRAEQYLESMANILKHAELELEHLQHDSVHVVVELAETITEKVMGGKPNGIFAVLEQSVQRIVAQLDIQGKQQLKLVVHPQDMVIFQRMGGLPEGLRMHADDNIQQGTCKLLSTHHDTLIDPKAMIHKAAKYLKKDFFKDV